MVILRQLDQQFPWRKYLVALRLLGLSLLPLFVTNPVQAAERINLSYGLLQRSISVDALETYVETGEADRQLAGYLDNLSPEQQVQVRQVLRTRIPLGAVEVSQFLYSPIGEELLERIGVVLNTDAPEAKFYALRSALILAADDPEGLTPLNIIREFPLAEIDIDLTRGLNIAEAVQTLVNQTQQAIAAINRQSALQAVASPLNIPPAPDLWEPGEFEWEKQTLVLNDQARNRIIPVSLYIPVASTPRPVIVISHGLGSDRFSFAYLADHLASYGFVVAVPEHPGSSAEQLQALLAGTVDEVTSPSEFVDRPLDIIYLLDELERLSQTNPTIQELFNLNEVGVVGQSFGGYTALALAGATIQPEQLATDCPARATTLNPSLLLQCLALGLPPFEYDLSDPRVKAAIAINPVDSSIFGRTGLSQINIPVMVISGSADRVAPALPEQIQPFNWLTAPNKYLVLLTGGTHFSAIGESPNPIIPVPPEAIGASPLLAQQYVQALNTAFFQTYVAEQPGYRSYLSAAYAEAISQEALPLSLIETGLQQLALD